MQETLGGNQLDLIQAVCGLIGEVRPEGADNPKGLKAKRGSAHSEEGVKEPPAEGRASLHGGVSAAVLAPAPQPSPPTLLAFQSSFPEKAGIRH